MCESSPQDTNTFSNIGCQTIELIFPKCKLEIKNRRLQNNLIKNMNGVKNVVKVKSTKSMKCFC